MKEIEYEYCDAEYEKTGNLRLHNEIPKQPNNSLKTGRERP
jgi:hypothetical protein